MDIGPAHSCPRPLDRRQVSGARLRPIIENIIAFQSSAHETYSIHSLLTLRICIVVFSTICRASAAGDEETTEAELAMVELIAEVQDSEVTGH